MVRRNASLRMKPQFRFGSMRVIWCNLVVLSMWETGDPEPHIAWTRQFWTAMQPFSTGSVYVNTLAADDSSRVREAYGPIYDRLADIKAKYDPTNLFRVNHNIRPTKAAAG